MKKTLQIPTEKDFKAHAKKLKEAGKYEKLGHALNAYAKEFGFRNYNAIRPSLLKESQNSCKSKICAVTSLKGSCSKTFVATEYLATWFLKQNQPVVVYCIDMNGSKYSDMLTDSNIEIKYCPEDYKNEYDIKPDKFGDILYDILTDKAQGKNVIIDIFDWYNKSFLELLEEIEFGSIDFFIIPSVDPRSCKYQNTIQKIETSKKPYIKVEFFEKEIEALYESDGRGFTPDGKTHRVEEKYSSFRVPAYKKMSGTLMNKYSFFELAQFDISQAKKEIHEAIANNNIALHKKLMKHLEYINYSKEYTNKVIKPFHDFVTGFLIKHRQEGKIK